MFGGSNDPFSGIEDLFSQLAGGRRSFSSGSATQSRALLNTVESKKETILIFDLSGKKVSSVKIDDELETNEYGERLSTGEKVLSISVGEGRKVQYGLPGALAKRKLDYTFTNGILEVTLRK